MSLETSYGKCIATYKGRGHLTFKDRTKIKCEFEAGQLLNGEIILLCSFDKVYFLSFKDINIIKFEGVTKEGFKIKSNGTISKINYLPNHKAKEVLALRLDNLSIVFKTTKPSSVRVGVTNFKFLGTNPFKGKLYLPLELRDKTEVFDVNVIPINDYEKTVLRVGTLKSIEVTCEVETNCQKISVEKFKDVVDSLCRLMSVARGTKIQWIYCNFFNRKGSRVRRLHLANITKSYCPMPLIDYRPEGGIETKTFLEGAFRKYSEIRDDFKLDKGMIDALLDARAENDYLELRAAKLAVTLEKLKAVFSSLPSTKTTGFIMDETKFKSLKRALRKEIGKVLENNGVDAISKQKICEKIAELNRSSFKLLLEEFFDYIGLTAPSDEIGLFIRCRNKLVHEGEFYCIAATTNERTVCNPLPSPREEYYFMINFLDRIFLKLLGYEGFYINWLSHMTGKDCRELL